MQLGPGTRVVGIFLQQNGHKSTLKGQGPQRVIFGPVKSQNMNRRKNATSFYICDL